MTAPGTIRTRRPHTDRAATGTRPERSTSRSASRFAEGLTEPTRRNHSDWSGTRADRPNRTDSTERIGRIGRSDHSRRFGGSRTGSRQQVSVRGRRIIALERGNPQLTRRIVFAVAVFVVGVISVMALSGVSTKQSFQIAEAQKRSTTLENQIESLNRDVANAKSSANIAKEASEMGMVSPKQAGILEDQGGKIKERRPAEAEGGKEVVDVNGNAKRRGATSDPEKTNRVEGLHPNNPVVAGDRAPDVNASAPGNAQNSGGLPYSGGQAGAPAGRPGAAPAPAPASAAPAPAPAPAGQAPAARVPAAPPAPAPAR